MTRVIRDQAGLYLKQGGSWTTYFHEAQRFPTVISAIELKRFFRLEKVELVIVIDPEPSWNDLVVPLADDED